MSFIRYMGEGELMNEKPLPGSPEDMRRLINIVDQAQTVEIDLQRAPDDLRENAPEFQQELNEFAKSLRGSGVAFSQKAIAFDSVDALGYPLAEFVIKTLVPALIPAAAGVCGAWVQARYGRKVRIKVGDIEAEARTAEEVERLLMMAVGIKDSAPDAAASKKN
jgi:hypothetical protein